eukprot:365707-Chlamydomonas_euryale.AAC.36
MSHVSHSLRTAWKLQQPYFAFATTAWELQEPCFAFTTTAWELQEPCFACAMQGCLSRANGRIMFLRPASRKRKLRPAKNSDGNKAALLAARRPATCVEWSHTCSVGGAFEVMEVEFLRRGLHDERGFIFHLAQNNGMTHVTWGNVLERWRKSGTFRACFSRALANVPLEAFFWETPAVSWATLDQPFSMVVLEAIGSFPDKGDPRGFAEHILRSHGQDEVATFHNLGRDAILLAPCPPTGQAGQLVTQPYGHLASFLRCASMQQRDNLWRKLGEQMETRLRRNPTLPVWIYTAGLGVPWLHVRIDDKPKYVQHMEYHHLHYATSCPVPLCIRDQR